jgi:hypothetical protein
VMVFGPVDSAEYVQFVPPLLHAVVLFVQVLTVQGTRAP